MTTTTYLLLLRSPTDAPPTTPSPAEMEAAMAEWNAWKTRFQKEIIDVGDKLTPMGAVCGATGVTDGPYVEGKEVIGGYMLVETETLEQAIRIADRVQPLLLPVAAARDLREHGVQIEYTGSTGRKLYDLADINKRGAALVYQGIGTAGQLVITQYAAFNTRSNRGQSQYHGVTFGLESRRIGNTGLQFTAKYTLSQAKDNLSSTFSDSGANYNLGYLDAFDPMLDYGYAEFDIRHRAVVGFIWELPLFRNSEGATKTLLGGWQLSGLFTARTGRPFSLWDCTNGLGYCMRAEDPVGIEKNATSGPATDNPNEFDLIDLSPIVPFAGGYVNPITGNSDFGPYPATMTDRGAFRGPGAWYVDLTLSKGFRFGDHHRASVRV